MDLFILDKVIVTLITNLSAQSLFQVALGGYFLTTFFTNLKNKKKVRK